MAPRSGRRVERCRTRAMKKEFSASVWRDNDWFIAQCLEVDVASQGSSEQEALDNLKEALALHFEPPRATAAPTIRYLEVDLGVA